MPENAAVDDELNLRVRSVGQWPAGTLETNVSLCLQNHEPHCCVLAQPGGMRSGFLAVSLRPYNPEGISLAAVFAATL